MRVSNVTTYVIQSFKAQWLIHVVHHSLTELWLDTTVFMRLVYGVLGIQCLFASCLVFAVVQLPSQSFSDMTPRQRLTGTRQFETASMTWRQIPEERRLQCLLSPTALNNSDNWACLLRGTRLDFKSHSEKFKTVERTDSGVIVVITETNVTSADTEDDRFAVIIRPVHGLMNENTGRSPPSMNVLHSEDLLTPLIKTPTKSAEMWQSASALLYVTIRSQTSRTVRYQEHKESCANRTQRSHQTCQYRLYFSTSQCLLQHRTPQFFSSSCHWRLQCCTDNNSGIADQSTGVIWGRGGQ